MPTLRLSYSLIVVWEGSDLRGVTFGGSVQYGPHYDPRNVETVDFARVDLTGVRRRYSDPPIRGYEIEPDRAAQNAFEGPCDFGALISTCETCDEERDPILNGEACFECRDCCDHRDCGACDHHVDSTCPDCDHCTDCCECVHCSHCGATCNDEQCRECERCSDCCECVRCDNCGETCTDTYCGECSHSYVCSGCCTCESEDENDDRSYRGYGGMRIRRADRHERKLFACDRLVGIEYEYNKCGPEAREWCDRWGASIHTDGSCGFEAVSPPIAGDHLVRCVRDLGAVMRAATIDDRCSVHVHVDASDLRWADMMRVLRVYSLVEPMLYLIGGQQRIAQSYCKPSGERYAQALDSDDPKTAILAVAYGEGYTLDSATAKNRHKHADKKSSGRYKGINIIPWLVGRRNRRPDTTIEFRIHRETQNADRVLGWCKLLATIVEWCAKATDSEVATLPKSGLRALATIAPDSLPFILERVKTWRESTRIRANSDSRRYVRRVQFSQGKVTIKCAA